MSRIKKLPEPTLAEIEFLLQQDKCTLRTMQWQPKIHNTDPQWYAFFSACLIQSEVHEDVLFRAQYRAVKTIYKGQATINQPEQFSMAIHIGEHRIAAMDHDQTRHSNRTGLGKPFYKQSFSGPHRHIWTAEGYGYAEPIDTPINDINDIAKLFQEAFNLQLNGGFVHPLKGTQLDLPL